jgi:hypothetical protein
MAPLPGRGGSAGCGGVRRKIAPSHVRARLRAGARARNEKANGINALRTRNYA